MKMRIFILLILCCAMKTYAQIWGDVNGDGRVSVADLTANVEEGAKNISFQEITEIILGKDIKDGHHFVDLGLPSGTLWASENITGYYAWGELTTKSCYDWNTYLWANGSSTKLNKYCTSTSLWGEYIDMDNRNTLETDDDAAHEIWSASWTIPTLEQWMELESKCKWTWTIFADYEGYIVKGPNGRSIFLPVTGFYSGYTKKKNSEGHYWANTIVPYANNYAYEFFFSETKIDEEGINQRSAGAAIRPVSKR